MDNSRDPSRIVTALIVGTVIALPGPAAHTARTHLAPAVQQGSCAVLGTYHVGPRVVPLAGAARERARVPTPVAGHATAGPALAWPAGVLRGTLVIRAYTGCGGATRGSFAVHRTPVGPPLPGRGRGAPALQCAIPCWPPPAGVISATGRFAQDPSHPHDATYVLVSATVTTTRRHPGRGLPCAPTTGCSPGMVITSTCTDVAGHLQVLAPAGQRVTLSFLLPPVASTGVARTALVLQGWRGAAVPRTVPMPGASGPAGAGPAVRPHATCS
jgi:hypothetical protein